MTATAINAIHARATRPVKPAEAMLVEWYRGSDLPNVLEDLHAKNTTAQVTIHLSQGTPSMIEVRHRILVDLTTR